MPSAAGKDYQRAEAGIQQWISISGTRGAAVDRTPFCTQLNSWDAPHIEVSVLVSNRIKKKKNNKGNLESKPVLPCIQTI